MKTLVAALLTLCAAAPALADVDTVCQGGGANGKAQSVEIKHWDSRVGSKIEVAKMNGIKTSGTYEGTKGEVMMFNLNGVAHVFGLEYNQAESTARLTGQGIDLQLFCSRY